MDQDGLRDYRRGLESVLSLLLKAHKDLSFIVQIPPRLDFNIYGTAMVEARTFTTLLEKAMADVVVIGRALNAQRVDVDNLLRAAEDLDPKAGG